MMGGRTCDAVVIGAGFFGCEVALELRRLGFERVVVAEREPDILRRASFVNQARVHNGYHYPRSYVTAVRSRQNFARFVAEYSEAVEQGFEKVYAIARGSRVSASQFSTFCDAIGAPCRSAPQRLRCLFDPDLIEDCFLTQEFAFDAARLATKLRRELARAGVELRLGAAAYVVAQDADGATVRIGQTQERALWVFNCTYGESERIGVPLQTRLKKELTEIVLIEPPLAMASVGVTVMDGPFFSTMPFPALRLHSLSHVRYTPHESAEDASDRRDLVPAKSHRAYMIRDSSQFMPILAGAKVVRSIFEVKTVLARSEADDARPILVERSAAAPRIVSILGAKIDNIFDVREYLDGQRWD